MIDEQVEQFEDVGVADAEEMDVEDIVDDFEKEAESFFKIPVKSCGKALKQVKKDDGGGENVGSDSDRDSSDSNISQCSNLSCSQNESLICLYKAEDISRFMQETKGIKGVQVEDFFPDCKQFINDVRFLMKEGAFQDVEFTVLEKLLTN